MAEEESVQVNEGTNLRKKVKRSILFSKALSWL